MAFARIAIGDFKQTLSQPIAISWQDVDAILTAFPTFAKDGVVKRVGSRRRLAYVGSEQYASDEPVSKRLAPRLLEWLIVHQIAKNR